MPVRYFSKQETRLFPASP
ncbi:hypothetical protein EB232_33320 [Mesorhizobium sp. NZP2077]|nr:hypothetical protein EB232_33320 [Mesorhizobium sp. NZP2077]QKD20347.1 hypothetical protein HGP13_32985 [Mesorhizobium sp. NZP2077]